MPPLVEEILARKAGHPVAPGQLVTAEVDRVYVQDGNTPTVARLFAEHGFERVFDPQRVGIFYDHSVLVPHEAMADRLKEARAFATRLGLQQFHAGSGISHVLAAELGWYAPGTLVLGADSHTCTAGAWQCLGLGMGASDIVAAMVTGKTWLKVPHTMGLTTCGQPSQSARPKDVMLYVLSRYQPETFLYRSVEWTGDYIEGLSDDGAATIANMGVEMGAKCVFLERPGLRQLTPGETLDLSGLPPFVARPNSHHQGVPLNEAENKKVDYVFVGSCANSRLEDLKEVADVLRHQKVHPSVHCVINPGSSNVYLEAIQQGYVETFIQAGAVVAPPGCGACVGTQGSIPASGDVVLSTMNRNFLGRMGNPKAEIWLSSPLVAAHGAVLGRIPKPEDLP